jgi:alkylation response protein AidB-like acyl-CoA dehydrogenase
LNFELSDEQKALQATLDQLFAQRCAPSALRRFAAEDAEVERGVWRGLAELGVLGLQWPEALGGAGLELIDQTAVFERVGYHAAPGPLFGHAVAGLAVALAGSEAQQHAWLPRLASGACIATVAFGEAGERWQPEQWTLAPGAGGRLRGDKQHVPCGRSADLLVVGLAGGALGLVEARAGGVAAVDENGIDRTRRLATVGFDGAACEELPRGREMAARVRDAALALLAADAYGGAARCVELAVAYAKQREQFGRPIAQFQALKHQLADLALDTEPCRALAWYAAHTWDRETADAPRAAAHAKSHVTDRFLGVARGTVEAHGGVGYTWDCEVQFWLKRAVFDRAFLGSPRAHRLRAAGLAGW